MSRNLVDVLLNVTTAQRDGLLSVEGGMLVWNVTEEEAQVFNANTFAWESVGGAATPGGLPQYPQPGATNEQIVASWHDGRPVYRLAYFEADADMQAGMRTLASATDHDIILGWGGGWSNIKNGGTPIDYAYAVQGGTSLASSRVYFTNTELKYEQFGSWNSNLTGDLYIWVDYVKE